MSDDRSLRSRVARALLATLAGCLVLVGCGGSSNFFLPGTPVVTLGNPTNSIDFAAYVVGIAGMTLTQENGNVYTLVSTPLTANLANLTQYTEVLEAPAIQYGTYTSATITLSYVSASIWASVKGQPVLLAPLDVTGSVLSYVTVTVNFDPAHPLVIPHNQSVRLQLTIDPAASNSIVTGSSNYATVQPFVVVSPAPPDATPMRARGAFVVSQPDQSNFIINVRPLYSLVGGLGALFVYTDAQTYFNVDGKVYTGIAGLNAMLGLQEAYPVAAIGTLEDLSGITPTFKATQVYVGASIEGNLNDTILGVVNRRVGNVINVHGALFVNPYGTVGFLSDVPVTVAPGTLVTQDGIAASGLTNDSVSVGQQVAVYGLPIVDSKTGAVIGLDASVGGLRLQPTPIWGTLNAATATEASLDVSWIQNFAVAGYNFNGTGTGGTAADPTHYRVSTGSFDAAPLPAGTLLQAIGFPTAFGSAPPEFTATSVVPGDETEQQLLVEWTNGGAIQPFVQPVTNDLVVNLANANLGAIHFIRTGPQAQDLKALPASPVITTAGATGQLQLAVGSATLGIWVYNDYAGFAAKLDTFLGANDKVYRLVCYGHYHSATNTFVASRIDVAFHL